MDTLIALIGRGFHKLGQEQKAVADQVHGIGVSVVGDVQHFLAQLLSCVLTGRGVDGFRSADAGQPQAFLGPQPVKLNPCVFPWIPFICAVGGDLSGNHQKSVPPGDFVNLLISKQGARAGYDLVEQIMVSGMRAVGMRRYGPFPAKLVQIQVNKALIPENVKFQLIWRDDRICHSNPLLF